MFGLEGELLLTLLLSLAAACAFEFVNGFHDTANAVATVIYTRSLKPQVAVVWSGIWNFLGVIFGGTLVATGIVNLLPADLLADPVLSHSMAMIMAMLLSAIIWNLGTWYVGLPASSSHTLIGSIIGVGIGYSFVSEKDLATTVNWSKAGEVGVSLLFSPMIGFGLAALLIWILSKTVKKADPVLFSEPPKDKNPPFYIRAILVLTCTMVSFYHGRNDGQKGVGLVMLILIVLVPARFALNHNKLYSLQERNQHLIEACGDYKAFSSIKHHALVIDSLQKGLATFTPVGEVAVAGEDEETAPERYKVDEASVSPAAASAIRVHLLKITKELKNIKQGEAPQHELDLVRDAEKKLRPYTDYAPQWVILMISVCLGIGTMVGWRRIVVTIGEKIGKSHLTYAQGATSELIAATTIGIASAYGQPVSTTHVLSSGIAGTMVATDGAGNLQPKTVRNIAMAWVLTLPVTIGLSAGLFSLFWWLL